MTESGRVKLRCGLAVAAAAALVLLAAQPAQAKKFKDKDLKGLFHYTVTEVRVAGADLEYCDSYGTIEFDGAGFAEVLAGARRCSQYPSGTVTDEPEAGGTFAYEVFTDGEFVMTELDDLGNPTPYMTHGRILEGGDLLLVDGTLKRPGVLLQHAVAAKE